MDTVEIIDIAEGLRRRLELLREAGVDGMPRAPLARGAGCEPCADGWFVFAGPMAGIGRAPCGHGPWKGALLGVWPVGRAAIVWGVPVSEGDFAVGPFDPEALSQLERMLSWLSGQLKAAMPDIAAPLAALAAGCPGATACSDDEAAGRLAGAIDGLLEGAKGVLLMGPLAAGALSGSEAVETARGAAREKGGRTLVVTWSPDELVRDPGLKKGALEDLRLLIEAAG